MKLLVTILVVLLFVGCNNNASIQNEINKLRPDVKFGTYYFMNSKNTDDLALNNNYIKNNCGIITVGSFMSVMQPKKGVYIFDKFKKEVQFAENNNLELTIIPPIGGNVYMPKWLIEQKFTESELREIMTDWMTRLMSNCQNATYIDVVNEALKGIDENGQLIWFTEDNCWMQMGWYEGKSQRFPKYLVEAYKLARKLASPQTKLTYNENSNSMIDTPNGMATYVLYKALAEEGVYLDGIGIQMHMWLDGDILKENWNYVFDMNKYKQMLQIYQDNSIPVHITEFDIELGENPTEENLERQGYYYGEILQETLKYSVVKTYKTWGVSDAYSWIRPWQGYNCSPLPLDREFNAKPAYVQMLNIINLYNNKNRK